MIPYDISDAAVFAGWVVALVAIWNWRKWRRSYHRALEMFATLLVGGQTEKPGARTPHQKAADTRRQRQIERMRAHRLELEADIARRKGTLL